MTCKQVDWSEVVGTNAKVLDGALLNVLLIAIFISVKYLTFLLTVTLNINLEVIKMNINLLKKYVHFCKHNHIFAKQPRALLV